MLEEPRQIGPYKIQGRLGKGGMGEVFSAIDENLGRRVAIKRVRPDVRTSSSRRQRFLREAQLAARLNHPSIVQIYSLVEEADDLYIVMEHVPGTTLRERLQSEGPLDPLELARIARALAEGLREAHRQGIIHRDLKTENVLLSSTGAVKMADFGIARPFRDSEEMDSITETQALVGTYRTMSPEQAKGERLDPRSDLFSMGVLLYEAATGQSPFPAENNLATLNRIISQRQIPAIEIRPELPIGISELIDHLLEKHPALRPQTADELLTILDQTDTSSQTVGGGSTVWGTGAPEPRRETFADDARPTRVETRGSRGPALRIGLLMALVVAAAGAYLLLKSAPPPLFVAVANPRMEAGRSSPASTLVIPAVRFGLTNGLLSLQGVSVLAPEDIEDASQSPNQLAKYTAADEILSTTLNCRPQSCQVTLRRMRGQDGTVVATQLFDVPSDDLQILTEAVLSFVRTIYSDLAGIDNSPLDVSAQDYEEFLRLETVFQEKDNSLSSDQILTGLDRIQHNSPGFTSAFVLAADVLRTRFHDTRDRGDLARAVDLLHQAEKLSPNSVPPLVYLFLTALAADRLDTAEEAVSKIERLDPGGYKALALRAYLLERLGSPREALKSMRAATDRLPSTRMLRTLANMEFQQGNSAEARETIRRAIAIVPEFRSRELLARIELLGGDPAEAARLYGELARQSNDFGIASNLGLALILLERYEEAASSFQAALELAPNNPGANLNLADARLLAGRVEDARKLYRRVVELIDQDPAGKRPELLTRKAQALAHLGRAKEAVASVTEALRQASDNPQTLFEASLVFAIAGEKNSALVHAEKAIELGCDRRWFGFAWFDELRAEPAFQELMATRLDPG